MTQFVEILLFHFLFLAFVVFFLVVQQFFKLLLRKSISIRANSIQNVRLKITNSCFNFVLCSFIYFSSLLRDFPLQNFATICTKAQLVVFTNIVKFLYFKKKKNAMQIIQDTDNIYSFECIRWNAKSRKSVANSFYAFVWSNFSDNLLFEAVPHRNWIVSRRQHRCPMIHGGVIVGPYVNCSENNLLTQFCFGCDCGFDGDVFDAVFIHEGDDDCRV